MRCPYCNKPNTRVINSRPTANGDSIRRRRICDHCGHRFSTHEVIEKAVWIVIKRNSGKRVPYNREQLQRGIEKACRKRPVNGDEIRGIVDYVEREVFSGQVKEATTESIGNLVLKRLKEIDKVAYIRFASVYKEFHDLQDFNSEIRSLMRGGHNRQTTKETPQ